MKLKSFLIVLALVFLFISESKASCSNPTQIGTIVRKLTGSDFDPSSCSFQTWTSSMSDQEFANKETQMVQSYGSFGTAYPELVPQGADAVGLPPQVTIGCDANQAWKYRVIFQTFNIMFCTSGS